MQQWFESVARQTNSNIQQFQQNIQDQAQQLQQNIQDSAVARRIEETTTRPCTVCQQRQLLTNVFTCEECKQLACRGCFQRIHHFNPTGECSLASGRKQVQVCKNCSRAVQDRVSKENVQHRLQRVSSFLDYRLQPYSYNPETRLERSFRLGSKLMESVSQVASFLPIGDAAKAINAGVYVVRYGPLVLFGNEVILALQFLINLSKQLDIPVLATAAPQDLFGGLYYMMGEHCGERGKTPELECIEHMGNGGTANAPSQELLLRLRRLVRVLYVVIYTEATPTDVQRLLMKVLPGSELVLAEFSDYPEVPSYFVTCNRREKKTWLILPGTRNVSDVATDVNAEAEEVPGGSAHRGMVRSAQWLLAELGPVLKLLYTKGYSISIVGHSLGAAVAALLTVFLRAEISSLKAYCFGTPACVDEQLVGTLLDCVVSVVNRDDLVPRLGLQSVQGLVESVLCTGQRAKTQAWMDEDWKAVQNVERIMELRRRGAAVALPSSTSPDEAKVLQLCNAGISREVALKALASTGGDLDAALLQATEQEALAAKEEQPQPGDPPAKKAAPRPVEAPNAFWQGLARLGTKAFSNPGDAAAGAAGEAAQAQPRFFVPGQVIHLYQQNGLSRAALAACTHEALTRIHPVPNMMEDHTVRAYDEALRQACIERPRAPRWESFEERRVCSCCDSDFNWAYVLKSEPQQMLARFHCYSCGKVVCDGCSQNRRAHRELGFICAVRTCDSCFYSPDKDH